MSDFIFSGNLRCTRDLYIGPNQTVPAFAINELGDVQLGGLRGMRIPHGTSAQRPFTDGTPNREGYIRYNTDTGKFEAYGGTSNNPNNSVPEWGDVGGVAGGYFQVVDGGNLQTRIKVDNSLDRYGGLGLSLYTSCRSQLIVDSTGNVGIGIRGLGDTRTTPCCALHVGGTSAVKLPVGNTAQRPYADKTSSHAGFIRYNNQTNQFEGFGAGDSWGSLGGVMDVDQDTFVKAESSANADNDELWFVTNGHRRMTIASDGNISIDSNMQINGNMEVLSVSKVLMTIPSDITLNGTVEIGYDADAPTDPNKGLYLWNNSPGTPLFTQSVIFAPSSPGWSNYFNTSNITFNAPETGTYFLRIRVTSNERSNNGEFNIRYVQVVPFGESSVNYLADTAKIFPSPNNILPVIENSPTNIGKLTPNSSLEWKLVHFNLGNNIIRFNVSSGYSGDRSFEVTIYKEVVGHISSRNIGLITGQGSLSNPEATPITGPIEYGNIASIVNVVSSNGDKYVFNGSTTYKSSQKWSLKEGTYMFRNVPSTHPMAILNNGNTNIYYIGYTEKSTSTVGGIAYDFYHGNILVGVTGDFGTVSIYCENHGYMGGQDLLVYEGQTEKVRIDSDGNVGIDTTTPQSKLDVRGSIHANKGQTTLSYFGYSAIGSILGNNNDLADFARFSHQGKLGHTEYALMQKSDGKTFLNASTDEDIFFRINNEDKMILKGGYDYTYHLNGNNITTTIPGGNIGIGTSTPLQKLHLKDGGITLDYDVTYTPVTTQFLVPNEIHGSNGFGSDWGYLRLSGGGRKDNGGNQLPSSRSWIDIVGYQGNSTEHAASWPYRNSIIFGTAGSERMRIQEGNVGIGTTPAAFRLDVAGIAPNFGSIRSNCDQSTLTGLIARSSDVNTVIGAGSGNNGSIQVYKNGTSTTVTDASRTPYLLRIQREGGHLYLGSSGYDTIVYSDLGIGTSAPRSKLHLNDGAFILQDTNTYVAPSKDIIHNEIHGSYITGQDYGFLRISAGGEGSLSSKSFIDLIGYHTTGGTGYNKQIHFGTAGVHRMKIYQPYTTSRINGGYQRDDYHAVVFEAKTKFKSGAYMTGEGFYAHYVEALHTYRGATGNWTSNPGDNIDFHEDQKPLSSDINNSNRRFTLAVDGKIAFNNYLYSFSDERIKKNIIDSDTKYDLNVINAIELKHFNYVDVIKRGNNSEEGFIAQQVKQVYPQAVTYEEEYIPNIYELFIKNENHLLGTTNGSHGKIISTANSTTKITLTFSKEHECILNDNLKIVYFYNNLNPDVSSNVDEVTEYPNIIEIIDNKTIVINEPEKNDYTEMLIYGKYTHDLQLVDKQQIFALNVGATQELSKEIVNLKNENQLLKIQLQELLNRISAIENKIS